MFKQAESAPVDAQKADNTRCKEKSRHSKRCHCHLEEMPVIPEQAMEFLSRTWSPSSTDLFQILSPSVRVCLCPYGPRIAPPVSFLSVFTSRVATPSLIPTLRHCFTIHIVQTNAWHELQYLFSSALSIVYFLFMYVFE